MAKPNYSYAKRQKELARLKKKEEKKQKKEARRSREGDSPAPVAGNGAGPP